MFRIISRLDIKSGNVINTVNLEGLRKVGVPADLANTYYVQGADELIFNDLVASLYGRNSLLEVIEQVAETIFIPLTVVGGIRSVSDARAIFNSGADKIGVNTAAVERPELLTDLVREFGAQAIVASIETRKIGSEYIVLTSGGRENTGIELNDWISEVIDLGVGEILVTSIDKDGRMKGIDEALLLNLEKYSSLPILLSGGLTSSEDVHMCIKSGISGIVGAGAFHTQKLYVTDLKKSLLNSGCDSLINWKV